MTRTTRKPTIGDRIAHPWTIEPDANEADLARRIDSAIRRAVKAERERCKWCMADHWNIPGETTGDVLNVILKRINGELPCPHRPAK